MYLCETHLHTSEGSACSDMSGAEQARKYKEAGYTTIFVTDHFFNGNTAIIDGYTDWRDRVEKMCLGYENAKAEGDKIGLKVFFGIEYAYTGADFLVYGIDKRWLIRHSELLSLSPQDFCRLAHSDGAYIIHAHPFREAGYLSEIKLLPLFTDAVEIYNGGNASPVHNDHAAWYAKEFGKPVTAGGDNHHSWDVMSGVMTEKPIESVEDYVNAVKNGEVKLIIPERNEE